MADIKVQKVSSSQGNLSKRELFATVCYFYPQYKLHEVAKLPARDVMLLLRIAHKQEAAKMLNLTQIAAAPHTEKGRGVKTLIQQYKKAAQ